MRDCTSCLSSSFSTPAGIRFMMFSNDISPLNSEVLYLLKGSNRQVELDLGGLSWLNQ